MVVMEVQEQKVMRKIIRFDVDVIRSPKSIRLWFFGQVLRLALLAGHPVVLIGACRTGKTLLLNAMLANIIDKRSEAERTGQWKGLSVGLNEIPEGLFGIDDCELIEPQSIERILPVMAEEGRAFALCSQRFGSIEDAIRAYRSHENSQALVILVMGGHRNPQTILDELPEA